MKKKFPHFTRINPASVSSALLRGFLLIGAVTLLSLNIKVFGQEAKKVLGASDEMEMREEELKQISTQYSYWKQVAIQKPQYQDAFITLALLAYQQGFDEEAQQYLTKAEILNPNNTYVVSLQQLLREGH